MVNFNNETTVSTPAANVVKLLILEAKYNAFNALELYNNKISAGISCNQALVRSRLGTWFMEHEAFLNRTLTNQTDKAELELVKEDLFFKKKDLEYSRILEIVTFLNNVMDQLRITRVDTKRQYDITDIEADNLANEYS